MNTVFTSIFFTLLLIVITSFISPISNSNQLNSSIQIYTSKVRYVGVDTALGAGIILNPLNETIIKAGLCYSKNPFPTVNDLKIYVNLSSDTFTCIINKLLPQTGYYVRAFVETSSGITYGTQQIFATDKLEYGELMHGGRLFYVSKPGDPNYVEGEFHGLVGVYLPMSSLVWDNGVDTLVDALDSAMFTGNLNTEKIVNKLGNGNYPAKICFDLLYEGYDDWFLPSISELMSIDDFPSRLQSSMCWSSSEYSKTHAKVYRNRKSVVSPKSSKYRFVAIRMF